MTTFFLQELKTFSVGKNKRKISRATQRMQQKARERKGNADKKEKEETDETNWNYRGKRVL